MTRITEAKLITIPKTRELKEYDITKPTTREIAKNFDSVEKYLQWRVSKGAISNYEIVDPAPTVRQPIPNGVSVNADEKPRHPAGIPRFSVGTTS